MRRMLTISLILLLTVLSAGEAYAQKAQRFRGIQLIGPTGKNQNAQKNQGVALLAPPSMSTSYSLVFPNAAGSLGQVLARGSGDNLAWVSLTDQSWSLVGNSTVDSTQNFIGTVSSNDNAPLIIRTDGNERMRITGGAGWVGIGTNNPAALLDVNGTLRVGGNATLAGTVTMSSVAAGVADDEVLLINSSNQITKTSRATLFANSGWALVGNSLTDSTTQFIGSTNAFPLAVRTNNLERMRVTSDGSIGIGTSTPAGRLDITSTQAARQALVITAAASQTANLINVRNSAGTSIFSVNSVGNIALDNQSVAGATYSIAFGNQGSGHGALLVKNATPSSQIFDFYFGRHGGQAGAQLRFWRDQATEVMRIMGSGDVGIGTGSSNPSQRLHIRGGNVLIDTVSTGTAGQLQLRNPAGTFQTNIRAGAQAANITYTLPTAAPTVAGQVLSAATDGTMSWSTPSSTSWALAGNSITDPSTQFLGTTNSQPLVMRTANSERMRITSDGNVGIGTQTANARLDIAGTVRATDALTLLNSGGAMKTMLLFNAERSASANGDGIQIETRTGQSGTFAQGILKMERTSGGVAFIFMPSFSGNPSGLNGSPIESMRLVNRSMGLGTGNPTERLHLSGGNLLIDTLTSGTAAALRFMNPARTFTTGFRAGAQTADITYTLPTAAPTLAGQVLSAATDGTMSWSTPSSTSWALSGNSITSSGGALGSAPTGQWLGTSNGTDLRIATNGNTRMIVSSAGAISMGSTLDVTGATTLSSTLGVTGAVTLTSLNGTARTSVPAGYDRIVIASSDGVLEEASISSVVNAGVAGNAWALAGNSITDPSTQFLGTTSNQPLVIRTNNTEKVRVTAAGRVGIGTNNPSQPLEIVGTSDGTARGPVQISSASGTTMGVGITMDASTGGAGGGAWSYFAGGSASYLPGGFAIYHTNSNFYRLAITSAGSVVVGNVGATDAASFNNRLVVRGNASVGSTYWNSTAPTNGLLVEGNVGIGTTSPGAQLQVTSAAAGTKGLIVRGAASATANLIEAQNSAGSVLVSVASDGLITGTAGATLTGTTQINTTGSATTTIGSATSTTTVGGTLGVTGLATATAGINLSGTTSPLQANGSAGTTGQVLTSAGSGATPTWSSAQAAAGIKSKGRSALQTNVTSFAITGITNLDTDDGVSVTLEGDATGLAIPSYYVVRTTGASGTVTVYFSSGYSGRVTWVVID